MLLNNDVVVADGWLGQLIGLVNMKGGPAGEVAGVSRDASADGAGRLRSIGVRGPETRAQRCGRDPGGFVSDGVRWTYRVHEQILPSLNRAKVNGGKFTGGIAGVRGRFGARRSFDCSQSRPLLRVTLATTASA